jgi:2-dehydro-3-deoxyphosphogalactonate aldolase
MTLDQAFAEAPLIAILRGVRPDEAVEIAEALFVEGVRIVEIPLNSPEPFESLRRVVDAMGERMICGSGTVLDVASVDRVVQAGGRICVSPNTDPDVIKRALTVGMTPMPGFATPTEALAAYAAGARWLKLFPAVSLGPAHLRHVLAVTPKDAIPLAVGGVGPAAFAEWLTAGARGFGLGSELYRIGDSAETVAGKARACMTAIADLRASGALA